MVEREAWYREAFGERELEELILEINRAVAGGGLRRERYEPLFEQLTRLLLRTGRYEVAGGVQLYHSWLQSKNPKTQDDLELLWRIGKVEGRWPSLKPDEVLASPLNVLPQINYLHEVIQVRPGLNPYYAGDPDDSWFSESHQDILEQAYSWVEDAMGSEQELEYLEDNLEDVDFVKDQWLASVDFVVRIEDPSSFDVSGFTQALTESVEGAGGDSVTVVPNGDYLSLGARWPLGFSGDESVRDEVLSSEQRSLPLDQFLSLMKSEGFSMTSGSGRAGMWWLTRWHEPSDGSPFWMRDRIAVDLPHSGGRGWDTPPGLRLKAWLEGLGVGIKPNG